MDKRHRFWQDRNEKNLTEFLRDDFFIEMLLSYARQTLRKLQSGFARKKGIEGKLYKKKKPCKFSDLQGLPRVKCGRWDLNPVHY